VLAAFERVVLPKFCTVIITAKNGEVAPEMVNLSMLVVLNILVGSTSRSITKMVNAFLKWKNVL
jgi:hypothetical protein